MSQQRQMFLSIRERVLTFLKSENNNYKYVRYYREQINKYIKEDDENAISACHEIDATILKQLLYILLMIYKEKTICKYISNDLANSMIENDIITDALPILKEAKYKDQKIVEINEINNGFSPDINSEKMTEITEITEENVRQIYINFHNIKKILELTEGRNEKHKEIDDYLFCLYYF